MSLVSGVLAIVVVMATLLFAASDLGDGRLQYRDDRKSGCPRGYWFTDASEWPSADHNGNGAICELEPVFP